MSNYYKQKNKVDLIKGFTLVELIVAIGIFSIVIVIALGAILVIIDSNKKSQTLTSVTTNLNFALESLTRVVSFAEPGTIVSDGSSISLISEGRSYVFAIQESDDRGFITRSIDRGDAQEITSPEIDIDSASFEIRDDIPGSHPRIIIVLHGKSSIYGNVSSDFNIQTTISPRKLNL